MVLFEEECLRNTCFCDGFNLSQSVTVAAAPPELFPSKTLASMHPSRHSDILAGQLMGVTQDMMAFHPYQGPGGLDGLDKLRGWCVRHGSAAWPSMVTRQERSKVEKRKAPLSNQSSYIATYFLQAMLSSGSDPDSSWHERLKAVNLQCSVP